MKGYWHISAVSVAVAALTVVLQMYWLIILLFLWLIWLYGSNRLRGLPFLVTVILFSSFYLYFPTNIDQMDITDTNEAGTFAGKIVSNVKRTDKKVDFTFHESSTGQRLLINYFPDSKDEKIPRTWRRGATCRFKGKLALPDKATNPGQFDYRHYLRTKGIAQQAVLSSLSSIRCDGAGLLSMLDSSRQTLLKHARHHLSRQTSAWLSALVFGDDSQIDDETVQLFQRWGLSHILAISGLHVGLLVTLSYFLLVKGNILTKEKAQWVMVCLLPIYAIIAGGAPSVWRASLMVMLVILLKKWRIGISTTDILSLVFIMLVIVDKYLIFHIGFQFSFFVTMAILLSKKWLQCSTSPIWQIVKISFVAQMAILPLQVFYFHTFQPLSILLNIIVVPYFSFFVIPFMFIMLLLVPFFGSFLTVLDTIFLNVHHVFKVVLQFIDHDFNFQLPMGTISYSEMAIYVICFVIFMHALERQRSIRSFIYGSMTVLLIVLIALKPYISPYGTVTMLDIGQGDAFVIELPYRKGVFIVDAGAKVMFGQKDISDSNYKQVIKPYLQSRGIRQIDAIFLSHEDLDHIGSVPFLLNDFNVKRIITSAYYPTSKAFPLQAKQNHTTIEQATYKQTVTIAGQAFTFLAPDSERDSPNANSLTVKTDFSNLSWLFTGDLDKQGEKQIVKDFPNLHVDVLKVAHHGSDTSSDEVFLKQINPEYGLISVGRHNRYGHPVKEVVSRLEDQVVLFRTDQNGAVIYRYRNHAKKGTFFKYLP